jgi:putative phosphonate catabolism associated alcohol dehydrogenase
MAERTLIQTQFQLFEGVGKPFQFESRVFQSELKPGEALVKILLSTICGSDIHTIEGRRKEDTPCILGHEAVGEIVAINSRPGLAVGDRVTWTVVDSCGQCPPCTNYELPEKCHKLFKYGHASIKKGSGLNGCYATHIHIRRGTHLVKVPDSVSDAAAAPANCALATMVNAISQRTCMPQKVVIQGGGMLGLYACGLLKELGVSQIFCLEIEEKRFKWIEAFGAIPVDAQDLQNATRFIFDQVGEGVDAVFEVAGIKELIPQGIELLRPGGDYILVGLVHPDSKLDITGEQIIRKCLHIKGIHNYAPRHLDEAISFLERNRDRFPFDSLVSTPFKLEEIEKAIHETRKQNWVRVSVRPE